MSKPKIPKPDFLTQEQWDAVLANRSVEALRKASKADTENYLATQGKGGGAFTDLGGSTLLITTTGRKSGNAVTTPLNYIEDGDNLVVVASYAGLPQEPNWWLNLQKSSRATVQVRDRRRSVIARKATAEERLRLWARLVSIFPMWGHFQKYSERGEFAVVILSPA